MLALDSKLYNGQKPDGVRALRQCLVESNGKFAFGLEVSIDAREMRYWHPDRISRFFDGIAKIMRAARGY